ncbi:MAG: HPr kinase/phosphorylase [Pararhizobium sp.]
MSAPAGPNVHATAIVAGTRGLLFVGEPGSGKSSTAFACLAEARARGDFAALVADDQVFLDVLNGVAVATAPPAIAGKLELRGGGIVAVPHLSSAVMHLAVRLGDGRGAERLPPEGGRYAVQGRFSLPMVSLSPAIGAVLAAIEALAPAVMAR